MFSLSEPFSIASRIWLASSSTYSGIGEGAGVAREGGGAGVSKGDGRGAGEMYSEGTKNSSSEDGQSENLVVTPSVQSSVARRGGLLVHSGPPQGMSTGTRTYVSVEWGTGTGRGVGEMSEARFSVTGEEDMFMGEWGVPYSLYLFL
jgi:hypothetical protein